MSLGFNVLSSYTYKKYISTAPSGAMGRRRDGNTPKKFQYRIQWEMKKMDTKFLTPTKQ
jgi:hypothetical protein